VSLKKQLIILVIASVTITGLVFAFGNRQALIAAYEPVGAPIDGAEVASSLGGSAGGAPVSDIQTTFQTIWQKITKAIDWANKQTKVNLLNSALRTYLNNIAYQSATYIASGGPGGKKLLELRVPNKVFKDAGNAALGDVIGRLSDANFSQLGIDLCDPSVEFKARLTLGIIDTEAPAPPRCDIRNVQEQWKQFGNSLSTGQWLSQATIGLDASQKANFISGIFSPAQNDIGAWLKLKNFTTQKQQEAVTSAQYDLLRCQGFLNSTKIISQDIVASCQQNHQIDLDAHNLMLQEQELLVSSDAVFLTAARLFRDTLYSKFLKKFIAGGQSLSSVYGLFTNEGDNVGTLRQTLLDKLRGNVDLRRGNATDFQAQFQTTELKSLDDYGYLDELGTCPQDRALASQNNCTIDQGMLAAITNNETVAEAIDNGHLNPNGTLISYLNMAQNGSKDCYLTGYCYSNLAKLRSYRILPLGWEIAASLSPVGNPRTLKEVIDCYDNGPGCVITNPADNIFYKLIDPNWVLTAPIAQCKALVNGPQLQDVITNQRQQVCTDHPQCLSEDGQGNCIGGYGYCTKESNIWRFSGTQCQEEFASCKVFDDSDTGARYTFLSDTVQKCSPDQAGCQWYSLSKTNFGTDDLPAIDWNPNDRIYLNNNALECPTEAAGCSEFIDPETTGVNLLTNGNFNDYTLNSATDFSVPDWLDDDKPDEFAGWTANGVSFDLFTTRDESYFGLNGLRMVNDGQLTATAMTGILHDQTVTLSWYAKAANTCQTRASIGSLSTSAVSADVNLTDNWQRFQMSLTYGPDNGDQIATVFLESRAACGNIYVDGVKLEKGSSASSYSEYGENGQIYLNGTRVSCSQEEVGCALYTPVNGDPVVPGVITENDICPSECLGYESFLQLANSFDLMENASTPNESVNLIPATAANCPAVDVNCQEFTNLDEVAAGGEGRHYYSFVRQCVKDEGLGVTYYTLEGSDTAGFQVRTWQVLPSNLEITNGTVFNQPNNSTLPDGTVIADNGIAGDVGPCTNIDVGGTVCTDTPATAAACLASEVGINPNCREFFDLDGNPHYRLQDKVIFASADCHPLRRTESGTIYSGIDKDSHLCGLASVGCSEYRGNQGNNLRTVFADTFERTPVTYDPWTGNITLSNEAVSQGGHSLQFSGDSATRPVGGQIVAEREYYLSFWAKNNDADTNISFRLGQATETKCNSSTCDFAGINIPVATDWQLYKTGPLYIDEVLTPDNINLVLTANKSFIFDNVILKEAVSNLYLIKNTWNTPNSCDQPYVGAMLGCQAYQSSEGSVVNLKSFSQICRQEAVGCQAVINTHNSNSPYQQTWHQGDPSQITVSADNLDYIVVDQDKFCSTTYQGCSLLGKPQIDRSVPDFDPGYASQYSNVYLINDPDTYDQVLCSAEGLFCREYVDSQGRSSFFKDPGDRTCTYREAVNIAGTLYTGWFKTNTLEMGQIAEGCSSDGIPPFGQSDFQITEYVDNAYDGWVGTCPAGQNMCTEYVDGKKSQGTSHLSNANFVSGLDGWNSYIDFGNTAPIPIILNALEGQATLITNPYGLTQIFQSSNYFSPAISNSDTYTLSASVKINDFQVDAAKQSYAGIQLRCFWDSPDDIDYCGTIDYSVGFGSVNLDLSSPCQTDDDCSGPQVCYKRSIGYCENSTTGDLTMDVCKTDADCDGGYSCHAEPYNGAVSFTSAGQRRDHDGNFQVNADLDASLRNQWQSLHVSADLGGVSEGDELIMCYAALTVKNNGPEFTAPPDPGGNSEVDFKDINLRKSQSYFYINDQQLDVGSCNGLVSEKAGCVLFNDVSNTIKNYNTYLTYRASDRVSGQPVSPVVCDPNSSDPTLQTCTNDANAIIKVQRDRDCSEWLSCRSSMEIFDSQTNSTRQVCNQLGLCNEYSSSADLLHCANWIDGSVRKLSYGEYVTRDTSFEGIDYSGYSLYNSYPVDGLQIIDVSINADGTGPREGSPDYRLVKTITCDSTSYPACGSPASNYGDLACGPKDLSGSFTGAVFLAPNPTCVLGVDGSRFDLKSPYVIDQTARGYAEEDGPFPSSVVSGGSGGVRKLKFGFQSANVCNNSVASCELGYYKMQYGASGSAVKYFSIDGQLDAAVVPTCICGGGALDGFSCKNEDSNGNGTVEAEERCPQDGSPTLLRRSESYLNWPGYCLEKDFGTPINGSGNEYACLTWLPVDAAPGGTDFFNQNREAGYSMKAPVYTCLEMSLKEIRTAAKTYCIDSSTDLNRYEAYNSNGDKLGNLRTVKARTYVGDASFAGSTSGCDSGLGGRDSRVMVAPKLGVDGCQGEDIGIDAKGDHYTDYCVASYDGVTIFYADTTDFNDHSYDRIELESKPFAVCDVIAQAVTPAGENAAITNRFWNNYSISQLNFTINQDDAPFGSAIPGSGFNPQDFELWKVETTGKTPRAGSPYACSSLNGLCDFIGDTKSEAYIEGWKNPGYRAGETYWGPAPDDMVAKGGIWKLKEIFQKIFGVYKYQPGNSCGYVCDDGAHVGQSCASGDDTVCELSSENTCADYGSKCINSVLAGQSCKPCPIDYSGIIMMTQSLLDTGRCVSQTWYDGALGCLTATVGIVRDPRNAAYFNVGDPDSYCPENYICKLSGARCDEDSDCTGTGDTCVSKLRTKDLALADCAVPLNEVVCNTGLRKCTWGAKVLPVYCTTNSNCQGISSDTTTYTKITYRGEVLYQGDSAVDALNAKASCEPAGVAYCQGIDFNDSLDDEFIPGMYISDPVTCPAGDDEYCRASGVCKPAGEVEYTGGICDRTGYFCQQDTECPEYDVDDHPTPCQPQPGPSYVNYCEFKPDSYVTLCDPDTDIFCAPNCSTNLDADNYNARCRDNSIRPEALPLDATMTGDMAASRARAVPGVCKEDERITCLQDIDCSSVGGMCIDIVDSQITQISDRDSSKYSDAAHGPFIAATECDPQTTICSQGAFQTFSINNVTSSDIVVENENSFLANLTFYAAAFKDHMPLRYFKIDWGDGSPISSLGYYKNALPMCTTQDKVNVLWNTPTVPAEQDKILGFAGTTQACSENYKSYFHVYRYDARYDTGTAGCIDGSACYKPRVMVQDNWGWCTSPIVSSYDWGEVGLGCDNGFISFPKLIMIEKPS